MFDNAKFDARELVAGWPEHCCVLDYQEFRLMKAIHEHANVTSGIGKLAVYLMYFSLSAYLSDNKITPPKAMMADMRKAHALVPQAELYRAGAPKGSLVYSESKLFLREQLSHFLRWNRQVRENTRIPEDERKLFTLAIRVGKPDVSDSAIRSIEKVAWALSPDLGGKINAHLHGASDGSAGTEKKASAAGVASLHTALKSLIKSLGGSGLTLAADAVARVKAKSPSKHAEYSRLRSELRKKFDIDWKRVITNNGGDPIDVVEAEKEMTRLGYELLWIPTKSMGFTGKVGLHMGKVALFTQDNRMLNGSIGPGSKVTMNPLFKDKSLAKEPYYMTVKAPGAVTKGTRVYTSEQKKAATVEKFQKADQVSTILPNLVKRWLTDSQEKVDLKKQMEGTAACLLYLTGARVGSNATGMASKKGVAAFGILNARVKHVKVTATNIIFTYPGKKGVAQKHTVAMTKPAQKMLGRNLRFYMENKKPDEMLWSVSSITGNKKFSLTYSDFNRYIKSMGFTQGAHKLRHVRGTQLTQQLLDEVPYKPSKTDNTLSKRQRAAETYMKEKILSRVADLLGHKSATKTGGTKPAWQTSITSYIQPNIVRQWFVDQKLDVPKWVPTKVEAE